MTVLRVLRPGRDDVEQLLSGWAADLIEAARDQDGIRVVDRAGPQASREEIGAALSQDGVIVYFGHGGNDGWGAPPLEELISDTDLRPGQLRAIVAVACYSAREFGRTAVSGGTTEGFVGFVEPLLASTQRPKGFARAFSFAVRDLFSGSRTVEGCADILSSRLLAEERLHGPGGRLQRDVDAAWIFAAALCNRQALRTYPRDL